MKNKRGINLRISCLQLCKQLILFTIILLHNKVFAQVQHGAAWVSGIANEIAVTRFGLNAQITQYKTGPTPPSRGFQHGYSNICDTNGKLTLLCDGFNLLDSNLMPIQGGLQLAYTNLYSFWNGSAVPVDQFSIILPFTNGIYYMVNTVQTNACFDSSWTINQFPPDILLYHKVDMKMNNGSGMVYERKIMLDSGRFESSGMMACRHGNGKDWWLLKLSADSVSFYTYLITQDSIIKKGRQTFPHLPNQFLSNWTMYLAKGQLMFNEQGTKMALVTKPRRHLYTFDFNRCMGVVSNAQSHAPPLGGPDQNMKGVSFSPNGRFIYVAQSGRILQFDTQATDSSSAWYVVGGLDSVYANFPGYENIYPANDGKIYLGYEDGYATYRSTINKPNLKGVLCEWCPTCLKFDSIAPYIAVGNPPCMPNYGLAAVSPPCEPLAIHQFENLEMSELVVYPNPATDRLHLHWGAALTSQTKLEVRNIFGQVLFTRTLPKGASNYELDISNLPSACYLVKVANTVRRFAKE